MRMTLLGFVGASMFFAQVPSEHKSAAPVSIYGVWTEDLAKAKGYERKASRQDIHKDGWIWSGVNAEGQLGLRPPEKIL